MTLGSEEAISKSKKIDEANGSISHSLAKQVMLHGMWGLIAGYAVLHPASMLIFHWLDPRLSMSEHSMHSITFSSPLVHSFSFQMAPMAIVFALIGAAVAAVDSYRRGVISRQRDNLQSQNLQLTQLELANRRAALFMAHDSKTPFDRHELVRAVMRSLGRTSDADAPRI
jgi:hypothetical protein